MSLTTLLLIALATWEVVEIWHHSTLFAGRRAVVETYDTWWSRLLTCPFCLAVWVSGLLTLMTLSATIVPGGVALSYFVLGTFSAARLSNVANDLSHNSCRTPSGKSYVDEE